MRIFPATFWILLGASSASAQLEVTGTVLSLDNRPIPGVNVVVKGTANGTATDMNGNFKVYVPEGASVLLLMALNQKRLEHPIEVRAGYRYEIYATLALRSQSFHKSHAVTGELSLSAPEITGRVFDQHAGSLGGVDIIIQNTVFKRTTDVNGYFSIPLPGADNALYFSLPGYKSLTVPAPATENNANFIKVVLVKDENKYRKMKSFVTFMSADALEKGRK